MTSSPTPPPSRARHTPEPWTLERHHHTQGDVWFSINRGAIDVTHNVRPNEIAAEKYSINSPEERQANAARIVACVNALAGMDPAAVRGVVEAARAAVEFMDLIASYQHINAQPTLSKVRDTLRLALSRLEPRT